MDLFLGVDIGGSSIKYGVGNCEQGLLHFNAISVKEKSLEEFRRIFRQILAEVFARYEQGDFKAIGIGTPGQVDHQLGMMVGVNPNLPFWTGFAPDIVLPVELDLPAYYDNDANLMALAEALHYPESRYVIGITIGSGIGCGLVSQRKIFRGSRGFAMDLGHVTSVHNGSLCNCGKRGCLEAYASMNGMRNRLLDLGFRSAEWGLKELLQRGESNPVIKNVILQGVEYFALALANLIVIVEPDHIVLGGGGSELELYPIDLLIESTFALLPPLLCDKISIEKAQNGNMGGVIGAIALAQNPLFAPDYT